MGAIAFNWNMEIPDMEHSHQPAAIAERLKKAPKNSYLKDWVYGGVDGTVTTFAVVTGVLGAHLSSRVLLILGMANLFADGFSMAAANYLSTDTEIHDRKRLESYECQQVELEPSGEAEEIKQIYRQKGFEGEVLETIVKTITSNKNQWVETMLQEEYGLSSAIRSPWISSLSTFVSFFICGLIPLLPFIFHTTNDFTLATLSTGLVFFMIGTIKSRWSTESWWLAGIKTVGIGLFAAGLAYLVGATFHSYSGAV